MSNGNGAGNGQPALTIIHFNDVYDVESGKNEPIGGAARFCTALKKYAHLKPVVLFSGDCFGPSLLSQFVKGEQMIPVLNHCHTDCAVYGNHDFDYGVDNLVDLVKKTTFPWLISNVMDNETGRPLGEGHITRIVERHGKKIGLMGLVEWEWMETLSTIDPEAVTYRDFVDVGNELSEQLRKEGCDIIIALTHMRFPNDVRLAESTKGQIDLILGGHDHVYQVKYVDGIPVLKSGTDFRDFSAISVTFDAINDNKPKFGIERISITSEFEEDPALKSELDVYTAMMSSKLDDVLGEFSVDLEGRFSMVRTMESNLGNFVCDIIMASCTSDCALLSGGAFRSDRIHPAGPFTRRDMMTVLPMQDPLVVLNVQGMQILEALENGVSQYPKLEGRFPQVSGIRYAFDPSKQPGQRVDPKFVKIGHEYLDPHQYYRLVTKEYNASGHDGFTMLATCQVLADAEECPALVIAVQNYFHVVEILGGEAPESHKQSRHHHNLITLARRHRQGNVDEMEKQGCKLAPKVEGRIVVIENKDVLNELMNERKKWEETRAISEEDENLPKIPEKEAELKQ